MNDEVWTAIDWVAVLLCFAFIVSSVWATLVIRKAEKKGITLPPIGKAVAQQYNKAFDFEYWACWTFAWVVAIATIVAVWR